MRGTRSGPTPCPRSTNFKWLSAVKR
jgi:hypothetical protein